MNRTAKRCFIGCGAITFLGAAFVLALGLGPMFERFPRLRHLLMADNHSISFHGRIVDQDGNSVLNLPVRFQLTQSGYGPLAALGRMTLNPLNPRVTTYTNKSDDAGYFHLKGFGTKIEVISMGNPDYAWNTEEPTLFHYSEKIPPPFTNRASAKEFIVWRKAPGYPLGSSTAQIRFYDYAGPHYVNLDDGRVSTNSPDALHLKIAKSAFKGLAELVITAPPNGLLYATNSLYPYLAPAATYHETLTVRWADSRNLSIFVRNEDRAVGVYATFALHAVRLEIATNIPAANIRGQAESAKPQVSQ